MTDHIIKSFRGNSPIALVYYLFINLLLIDWTELELRSKNVVFLGILVTKFKLLGCGGISKNFTLFLILHGDATPNYGLIYSID